MAGNGQPRSSFDRAYIREMVVDHSKGRAEFGHEANRAKNPELKNFASETLTTIQDHLKPAKGLEGTPQATSSSAGTY